MINQAIRVDQKVYHYDSTGKLMGIARVPLANQYIPVSHSIAIAPDGEVYALILNPNGAEVQRLIFNTNLPSILTSPKVSEAPEQSRERLEITADCRSRTSMLTVVKGYYYNSTYLNSYHMNDPYGECITRTKPPNLTLQGWYSSVPYAWGMGDTVEQYNSFMSGGNNQFFAGDITDPNSGCARGIDCSGLVSNAWDLGDHLGTCSLESVSVSRQLSSLYVLQSGDIMNKCSTTPRHTILFEKYGNQGQGQGIYGYESTITTNAYGVDYTFRLISSLTAYNPREYIHACNKISLPLMKKTEPRMGSNNPPLDPYPIPSQTPYP